MRARLDMFLPEYAVYELLQESARLWSVGDLCAGGNYQTVGRLVAVLSTVVSIQYTLTQAQWILECGVLRF